MENLILRDAAKAKGVKLWQIAERVGIAEATFSRKLRHDLPVQEQQKILSIIDELTQAGKGGVK